MAFQFLQSVLYSGVPTVTRGKKVLLVDDAEVFLEVEKSIFKRTGAQIFTAKTGREALELVHREKPDIILLDLKLPDLTGIEVCREVKRNPFTSSIPVVMVTAFGSAEDVEACRQAGCDDFLSKPIDQKDLLQKVAQILRIPHRHSMRVLVRLEIEANGRNEAFFCTSSNISTSGILLETEKPLKLGNTHLIKFFLPGNVEIKAEAEIVREDFVGRSFRYGLRFIALSESATKALNDFIQEKNS